MSCCSEAVHIAGTHRRRRSGIDHYADGWRPVHGAPVIGLLGGTVPAPEIVKPFLLALAGAGNDVGRNDLVEYRCAHDQADWLPGLIPRAKTIAALFKPRNAGTKAIQHELRVATAAAGVQLVFVSAATEREIEPLSRPWSNSGSARWSLTENPRRRLA